MINVYDNSQRDCIQKRTKNPIKNYVRYKQEVHRKTKISSKSAYENLFCLICNSNAELPILSTYQTGKIKKLRSQGGGTGK